MDHSQERVFIAYSYSYIDEALEGLDKNPDAKAIVIQPYSKSFFRSAKKVVDGYRAGEDIPILLCREPRFAGDRQVFEYGARLLDILDVSKVENKDLIQRKVESGEWLLQSGDEFYSQKNALIVKAPITALNDIDQPIEVGFSMNWSSNSQSKYTRAVQTPSPKIMIDKFKHILHAID